ncbi:phosphorylase [Leptospira jelokensis]|uniref:Phosphorylase n=1 Tax=Leptospira jelokensis TaxID=2484931 RepID=A0A4Z0ZXR1_9LEPT|nr:phosphorylase [Leptospira jelokensis]TGL64925.1 phosphorylase [Leptospira jelokensis]
MPSLFFALLSEAKPWIQKTKVTPLSHSGKFRIYQNESTYIIISGPGKIPMALAVSEFASLLSKETRNQMKIWNLGIAGGNMAKTNVGDFYWIHKIRDFASQKDYYPERIQSSSFKKETNLTTFDRPVSKVQTDNRFQVIQEKELETISLVDMEGSGFFEAASLYFPLENIAIGKQISDFLEGRFCKENQVEEMMGSILDPLFEEWNTPLPWMEEDVMETKIWPDISRRLANLRLTETMKHDLKKSLRFFHLRNPNAPIPPPDMGFPQTIKSKSDLKLFLAGWKEKLHA